MHSSYLSRLILILITTVSFAIPGLFAEEAVDVVVTAGRSEEAEMETPAHVTVISSKEIMNSGEQSLVGVLDSLAGVDFSSYAGPEKAQIDMRGFGSGSHGRVLVMVDGKRLNSQDMEGIQWLSIPLESIKRVEVVHGSESVLYGNHAVGGVVNVVTKDSEEEAEFTSTLDFGSYYSDNSKSNIFTDQRLRFGTNQGATDGAVSFAHSYNGGHRDRSETRSVGTRLDGGWNVTEIFRLEADLGYDWTKYQMPGALAEKDYQNNPASANNQNDEAESHEISTSLGLEWYPFYNTEISFDGAYRHRSRIIDMGSWSSFTDRLYHTVEASPKVTVEGEAGTIPWKIVGGADSYISRATITKYDTKQRDSEKFTAGLDLTSIGGFLRPIVELGEQFSLEGGVRYEYAEIAGRKSDSDVDDSATHQAFVYDGALLYRPADEIKLYAKGGTTFRYPFTDEQAAVAGMGAGFNSDLEPETGMNAELGGSFTIPDSLTLKANGYYLLMDDEIAYDPTSPSSNSNLEQTRRFGADAELEARLHRAVGLSASYGFVDARFAEGDNEGNMIPLVSAHTADASLDIRPISSLTISPEASFHSKAYKSGDKANEKDPIDSYWLLNLELSYSPDFAGGNMQIKLKAENILDELYATFASYSSFTGNTYYPAPGRSMSVVASYSY